VAPSFKYNVTVESLKTVAPIREAFAARTVTFDAEAATDDTDVVDDVAEEVCTTPAVDKRNVRTIPVESVPAMITGAWPGAVEPENAVPTTTMQPETSVRTPLTMLLASEPATSTGFPAAVDPD
jgi:hypothetical protein